MTFKKFFTLKHSCDIYNLSLSLHLVDEVYEGLAVRPWEDLRGWDIVDPLPLVDLGVDVHLKLSKENEYKADGNEPWGEEPGDGELPAHDAGVAVHCECLESLDGHAKDGEEAGDDGHHKETVDEGVLVTWNVEYRREGNEAVQQQAQREEGGGQDVGVGEEAVGHRVVDELGHEDNGCDNTDHKTDSADDNVKVGESHDGSDAEEGDEEGEDEKANPDNKMYCN